MLLFLDTETTGFPKMYGSLTQNDQARVCQIAMLLTDQSGRSLIEFSSLIQLNGVQIHPKATEVHGFTTEQCDLYGLKLETVIGMFLKLSEMADVIIAHNASFDKKMMQIEAAFQKKEFPTTKWFCTMEASTPICDIPPTDKMKAAGFNKNKNPNLEEALQIICKKSLGDGSHDAMFDCRGCKDVYFGIKKINQSV